MSFKKAVSILDDTINYLRSFEFSSQLQSESKCDSDLEWPAHRVREQFISFFRDKNEHTFKPSSPVVPLDDPTIKFANAGMNQFKPIFLGNITDDDPLSKLKRACNSQKCIRAGGKHNDLDDVGKDTYHHTFFEMLGNWSFGDYFKEEAISMAWDLLINIYKLDPNRVYATYFGGDDEQKLESDDEARRIWLKYLPESRVLPFGMHDNFWEMGDTGPCGPCTEIHYDRMSNGRDASSLVNMDDPTVIEIWNLVFIQFNRNEDQSLQLLPNKHVDTGMGFERVVSILQDKQSNYDTDVFMPIIEEIQKKTGCTTPYSGKVGAEDVNGIDMAYRVVADHIRTLTFAIADGAAPGRQDRDYVVRRVCRRGVRFGTKLGGDIGFFKDLVDVVVREMGATYPEIVKRKEIVKSIIEEEELLFSRTLRNGEKRFKQEVVRLKAENKTQIPSTLAFKLHSMFGFPFDLTTLLAEEEGMTVDKAQFEERMEEHREKSKKEDESQGFAKLGDPEKTMLQQAGVQQTDDSKKYIWNDIPCTIAAIFDSQSKALVDSVTADHEGLFGLILDSTSFYAESGGQCGDIGYIEIDSENAFKVNDVQEFAGFVIHIGEVTNGVIKSGAKATAKVDYENRKNVAPNHTMTHVLNLALRNVLGEECNQKGSLNDAEKLRFDYNTNRALTTKDIDAVSTECRNAIDQNLEVITKVLEYQEAMKINALRAMFGERYPKMVRVVAIGIDPEAALKTPNDKKNLNYSIELCGGTHVARTGEAGSFVFLSDDALSAGIRRVVCLTGFAAKRAIQDAEELGEEFKEAASLSGAELSAKCPLLSSKLDTAKICAVTKHQLRKELVILNDADKAFKKQLGKQRKKKVVEMVSAIDMDAHNGDFVVKRIDVGMDKKALKEGIKKFYKTKSNASTPIMLISCSPNEKNKIIIVAEVPKAAVQKGIHCGQWVSCTLPFIDGPKEWKGGKSDKKAEVQGTTMSNVAKVIEIASKWVNEKSSS